MPHRPLAHDRTGTSEPPPVPGEHAQRALFANTHLCGQDHIVVCIAFVPSFVTRRITTSPPVYPFFDMIWKKNYEGYLLEAYTFTLRGRRACTQIFSTSDQVEPTAPQGGKGREKEEQLDGSREGRNVSVPSSGGHIKADDRRTATVSFRFFSPYSARPTEKLHLEARRSVV